VGALAIRRIKWAGVGVACRRRDSGRQAGQAVKGRHFDIALPEAPGGQMLPTAFTIEPVVRIRTRSPPEQCTTMGEACAPRRRSAEHSASSGSGEAGTPWSGQAVKW
jgi:hypothetical protein